MSSTAYLSSSSKNFRNPSTKRLTGFVTAVMAAMVLVLSVLGGVASHQEDHEANADIGQWIMCTLIPSFPLADNQKDVPKNIYQMVQTDDMHFYFRSKSNVTSGMDDVDGGLNWLLEASGSKFRQNNEAIIGRSLTTDFKGSTTGTTSGSTDAKKNYNKGTYVNPFDRFGVAGMKYSAYLGEWKYFVVDACSTDASVNDPKAGAFYDGRKEPQSTWDDQNNSKDVRTKQFSKGTLTQFSLSAGNNIANGIFTVTKFIVVLTIALVNFSFSDIVSILGVGKFVAADGGIFKSLFNGIFLPLVFIAFVLTAGWIFYTGIVKRQYRSALTSVIRSIVLFICAVVIAAAPAFFISLPNQVAVGAQSIILTSLDSSISGGDEMCATNVGAVSSNLVTNKGAKDIDILGQTSKNVRSVVGCQMWQMFLLKPWAQGQFGTDINDLWADKKVPGWAHGGKAVGNVNGSMVGDAEVPLGGGKTINNWGIYQISIQTNAHSENGKPGQAPSTTNGVANDWWRIVDALANYQEEDTKQSASYTQRENSVNTGKTVNADVKVTQPKANHVLPEWDTWVGNNMAQRIGTSISSVFVAGIGVSAVLFFSALSVIYALGTAILMAFSPFMLLLGCWAPSGYEIFKGWGELVINTVMKRIATGLMLVLAILFTSSIIRMASTLQWWQVLTGLILISVLLIKSRHRIIDSLASFRFATASLGGTASRLTDKLSRSAKTTVNGAHKATQAGVSGGLQSKRYGGTFRGGVFAGLKNEVMNAAYRSRGAREFLTTYENEKSAAGEGDQLRGRNFCAICGKSLDYEMNDAGRDVFHGGRDKNGNLICNECLMDGVDPDAQEVIFYRPTQQQLKDKQRLKDENQHKMYEAFQNKMRGKTRYDSTVGKKVMARARSGVDENGLPLSISKHEKAVMDAAKTVDFDIADYKKLDPEERKNARLPEIPEEIRPYVDENAIEYAWANNEFEYIEGTYAAAFVAWYQDEFNLKFSATIDEVINYLQHGVLPQSIKVDDQRDKDNR